MQGGSGLECAMAAGARTQELSVAWTGDAVAAQGAAQGSGQQLSRWGLDSSAARGSDSGSNSGTTQDSSGLLWELMQQGHGNWIV